jgi:hypothetical protein
LPNTHDAWHHDAVKQTATGAAVLAYQEHRQTQSPAIMQTITMDLG